MAFDLNEKPWYVALLIGVVLGVVLYLVMNSYVFKPIRQEITGLNDSIAKLQREIQKGRAAKRDLPKLEEEIRNLELELDRLRLTEIGHFQLRRFTPQQFIDRDFYWEWPIKVSLSGTYHELGLFFDRLSRFSRIINVSNLKITALHKRGSPFTINADFTQQTFIYKEDKDEAAASQGAGK